MLNDSGVDETVFCTLETKLKQILSCYIMQPVSLTLASVLLLSWLLFQS